MRHSISCRIQFMALFKSCLTAGRFSRLTLNCYTCL
jgi:hypothetical protein